MKSAKKRAYNFMCKGPGQQLLQSADQIQAAIADEILAAQREVREEAVRRVKAMPPGMPTGAGDYEEWTLDDVERELRAIKLEGES